MGFDNELYKLYREPCVVKLKGLQWTGHIYCMATKKDVAPYSLAKYVKKLDTGHKKLEKNQWIDKYGKAVYWMRGVRL
jgi:hypothetical protein